MAAPPPRRYHALPPKVTGLSPKEGPPGTKVTIRGENLGSSPDDLIGLTICGQDCLIYSEWVSPSKILTRSLRCKGLGDVIVATKSGGIGSCTVQFRGYEEVITLTKESAVWVNEDDLLMTVSTTTRHRAASSPTIMIPDPLGIEYRGEDDNIDDDESDATDSTAFNPGATLITSESFDPALFLSKKHRRANFHELRSGLDHLRRSLSSSADRGRDTTDTSPLTLLKPNVLAVVECLDALKAVHLALKKDRQELGQDLTLKIEEIVRRAGGDANTIFDSILAKKDMSDSTRNALTALKKNRFLFNLPSTIERNIQKGEYEAVITDYARAKALFEKTEVRVFRKVYGEVEQRVRKLKTVLQEKLKEACNRSDEKRCSVDEIKKLIRHLVQLGVEGNPGWECIVSIKDTLQRRMIECRDKHLALALSRKDDENPSSDPPQTVLFAEDLVTIFNSYYPDLVRLGDDYFNGHLYSKDTEEGLKRKEVTFQKDMTQELVRTLVTLLKAALLPLPQLPGRTTDPKSWPLEKCESMTVWLPHCLRTIIECYQSLLRQETILSSNSLDPMQQLIFDFRVHSVSFLFTQVSEEVKKLYLRENWDVLLDNAIGARTQLPLLFESKVIEILQLVRETILQTTSADEVDIFSQINVQGQMKQLVQNIIQSFMTALEKTLTDDIPAQPKTMLTFDDKLLVVMSNCVFTASHVLPRLQESLDKNGYPEMSLVMKFSTGKMKELEIKLLKQYIEKKRDFVIGSIETSMYFSSVDWFVPDHKPSDVSFYVKELLMNLIQVQAQVYSISPSLIRRVLVDVIDGAIEEVSRLHECVAERFNEYGNLQAFVDFSVLKIAFRDIESESTEKLLESSGHYLRPIRPSDRDLIDRVLNQIKQSMHMQLYCFKWETDQTVIVI